MTPEIKQAREILERFQRAKRLDEESVAVGVSVLVKPEDFELIIKALALEKKPGKSKGC